MSRLLDFGDVALALTGVTQVMKNMLTLRDEGHFKHIGLSE